MKKICVITGGRPDYGLLREAMFQIRESNQLRLQMIATGMHLSPEFGNTKDQILEDGFTIDREVENIISSDTRSAVVKSIGLGMIGFADAFRTLSPDCVLVLGDRSEIFAGVVAAMVTGVPVGHIHGGEITEGSIDENIRHAITKMAHLHFVAAEEYRARVIQLGEQPKRVYTVGALGIDGIKRLQLLDWQDLKTQLGIENYKKNVLVTFHPVTIEYGVSAKYLEEVLSALSELNDTQIIFSLPNSDAEGRMLQRKIKEFAEFRKNVKTFASLGQLRYLSCLKFVDCVIGNSSSGLIEAPTLKTATINIGDRQFGRLKADSVLDCKPQKDEILAAVRSVYTPKVRHLLRDVKNPYGEGCASNAIVKILERESLDGLLRKSFYDMPHIQSDF